MTITRCCCEDCEIARDRFTTSGFSGVLGDEWIAPANWTLYFSRLRIGGDGTGINKHYATRETAPGVLDYNQSVQAKFTSVDLGDSMSLIIFAELLGGVTLDDHYRFEVQTGACAIVRFWHNQDLLYEWEGDGIDTETTEYPTTYFLKLCYDEENERLHGWVDPASVHDFASSSLYKSLLPYHSIPLPKANIIGDRSGLRADNLTSLLYADNFYHSYMDFPWSQANPEDPCTECFLQACYDYPSCEWIIDGMVGTDYSNCVWLDGGFTKYENIQHRYSTNVNDELTNLWPNPDPLGSFMGTFQWGAANSICNSTLYGTTSNLPMGAEFRFNHTPDWLEYSWFRMWIYSRSPAGCDPDCEDCVMWGEMQVGDTEAGDGMIWPCVYLGNRQAPSGTNSFQISVHYHNGEARFFHAIDTTPEGEDVPVVWMNGLPNRNGRYVRFVNILHAVPNSSDHAQFLGAVNLYMTKDSPNAPTRLYGDGRPCCENDEFWPPNIEPSC